jgi:hypothetical protein
MRIFTLLFLAALFCSCEESKYYIHITNNTVDTVRGESGQIVLYALAKDSGTVHAIPIGGEAVHEVSFGVPHGIAFYGPQEGKTRNIGVRYTGDDRYEFYTLEGIPFSVINTLSFDVGLRCGEYLKEEPLEVPKQAASTPGEKTGIIYTQTPNFRVVYKDGKNEEQEYPAVVTFTVDYDDDGRAERIAAEIR